MAIEVPPPDNTTSRQETAEVLRLRAHAGHRAIAKHLGKSASTVCKKAKRAMREVTVEDAQEAIRPEPPPHSLVIR